MLKLTEIQKSYGALQVLKGASLQCQKGESVCLAGANAAGKTTLLRIAAGLQRADAGSVVCSGRIRFVPQENELFEDLTLKENLKLWYLTVPRAGKPFEPGSPEDRMGLQPYAKKRINALSGGIKKRTAIACALAGRPDFLLMDEPFTALDFAYREEVCILLEQVKETCGVLFSSHDPDAIARAADRAVILNDGKLSGQALFEGTHEEKVLKAVTLLAR